MFVYSCLIELIDIQQIDMMWSVIRRSKIEIFLQNTVYAISYHNTHVTDAPVYACCINRCFFDPMISLNVLFESEKHSVSMEAM